MTKRLETSKASTNMREEVVDLGAELTHVVVTKLEPDGPDEAVHDAAHPPE
jgi:hypothetical protein